jgi:hypothetical protein
MRDRSIEIKICSQAYWIKVIDMLQQNWALVEPVIGGGCIIYFVADDSGVFDAMSFPATDAAQRALRRNGFSLFAELISDPKFGDLESIMPPPKPPFFQGGHRNGKIYSSGMYWK